MHVATLLCDPALPRLEPAVIEPLRSAWSGGPLRWLADGIAAEFDLDTIPDDRWQVWQELQSKGVDMLIVPAAGRRKRLLLADMDSTMIGQECIDELAAVAGFGAEVAAITARAMNGELEFESALRERVGLLTGLDAGVIDRVLAERISFTPGGAELIATMRAAGARTVLVSGGFTAFTGAVARHLGFDEHRANRLLVEGGRLTGKVAEPILGRQAKLETLRDLSAQMGIGPAAVLAVGDGANDLAMLQSAGAGVALHAKPAVAAQCDLRVNHGDLTALLYLQGFRQSEFARPAAAH